MTDDAKSSGGREDNKCSECGGLAVEFRGKGMDMEYRICTRIKDPGHLTPEQVRERIREVRGAMPERWA